MVANLRGLFIEEGFGSGFDAKSVASERHCIEVHGQNFLLGVVLLQLHGNDPFFELGYHLTYPGDFMEFAFVFFLCSVQVFRQLHGDGTASTCKVEGELPHHSPDQAFQVNS